MTHRTPAIVLLAALVVAGAAYAASYASIVELWNTNASFSHGFLIVPICLWLAWRKRAELSCVPWQASWGGVVVVAGLVALWVVARGAGVRGVEDFAVVALVPGLVLALLGPAATRVLAFPLAFLLLAIPVGHVLVPTLMQFTADIATAALRVSGVPVHRTNMFISIPAGDFEVARACSGLNYFLTGLALGLLYAYLTYASWRKRLACVAAFIVLPVLANGLRVYLTILAAHLTDMRYGPGAEHVLFGKVFFIVVVFAMFWIGQRWRDPPEAFTRGSGAPVAPPAMRWVPAVLALLLLPAGPAAVAAVSARVATQLAVDEERLSLPAAGAGWFGPVASSLAWRPLYAGYRADRSGVYRGSDGAQVDVFVALYGIGTAGGGEMISFGNRIFEDERKVLADAARRRFDLPTGGRLVVNEQAVADSTGRHLVWHWFMVGTHDYTDPYQVKFAEARAFLTGDAVSERILTLSTPIDGGEQQRLAAFLEAHATCLAEGLDRRGCSR